MTLGPYYTGDTPSPFEVHIDRDGDAIGLDGYSAAEVLLYDPTQNLAAWTSSNTIDAEEDFVLVGSPAATPFEAPGRYQMYLRMTLTAGGVETFYIDDILVRAVGQASAWATRGETYSITGSQVTENDIDLAQSVIETNAGRTFAGSSVNASIRAKDLVWLKKAVAYQASWMPNQPGYFNRHSVKEVNQDGAQIIYAGSSEPNNTVLITLAPLANRALKNLSWMGTRSIAFRSPSYEGDHPSYGDYRRNDEHGGWGPM